MKKQYTIPRIYIVCVNSIEFVCASANFGDGDTPIMHAKENVDFLYFEDDI